MKIINPNNAGTHTINLVPRFDGFEDITKVVLTIYNESIREFSNVTIISYVSLNGIYTLGFTIDGYTILENDTFDIKLIENTNSKVLYKGKILATTQTPQDYELTDGLYTYN